MHTRGAFKLYINDLVVLYYFMEFFKIIIFNVASCNLKTINMIIFLRINHFSELLHL